MARRGRGSQGQLVGRRRWAPWRARRSRRWGSAAGRTRRGGRVSGRGGRRGAGARAVGVRGVWLFPTSRAVGAAPAPWPGRDRRRGASASGGRRTAVGVGLSEPRCACPRMISNLLTPAPAPCTRRTGEDSKIARLGVTPGCRASQGFMRHPLEGMVRGWGYTQSASGALACLDLRLDTQPTPDYFRTLDG